MLTTRFWNHARGAPAASAIAIVLMFCSLVNPATADTAPGAADLLPVVEGITVEVPPAARTLQKTPALAPAGDYVSNSWRQGTTATRGLSFSSGVRAPASGLDPALRTQADSVRAQGRPFVYGFLLLRVPLDESTERLLTAHGVDLLGRHDDHHKVRLPVDGLAAIAALPEVEWVGTSAPDQKSSQELAGLRRTAGIGRATPIPIVVNLFEGDEHGEFRRQIEAAGATVGTYDADLHFYRAVATGPVIERIAALDFVLFIELIGPTTPEHDDSMTLIDADMIRPGSVSYGLTRFSGAPIPVGIIDSGAALGTGGHVDLSPKRACGSDFTSKALGAYVDELGHGTHVLGTIAGTGTANPRYRGAAPGVGDAAAGGGIRVAKIWAVNDDGSLASSTEWLESAIDWMVTPLVCGDQLAPLVINHSGTVPLSGSTGTDSTSRKLDYRTYNNRQLYVISSGNTGPASGSVQAPGVAKNALTVGNVNDRSLFEEVGEIYTTSSRGPTGDGRMKPNVVAPGHWIVSAQAGTTDGYAGNTGTSMAAPHVTALAATLMQHYPQFQFNPAMVRAHLMATAMGHDGNVGKSNTYGLGRVSSYVAHWDHPNADGWETRRFSGTVNSFGFAWGDITVPAGAKRLVVAMTWDEPPASAGASRAVVYDIDLFVDRDVDCSSPTGACGDYASISSVDNVEYVVVENPPPGVYRLKVVPYDASPQVLPWGMSAVIIRGDARPSARAASPPAMRASTTGPSGPVVVGETFGVTVDVLNDSYVASAVEVTPGPVPAGVTAREVEAMLLDGVTAAHLNVVSLTYGNIPPSWQRSATWNFRADAPGAKTFTFRVQSENSGEITVTRTVSVVTNADLTVSALTTNPPAPARAPGTTFKVTSTVLNAGTAPAGSSKTRYYLSIDAARSADDILLTGIASIGGLAANQSRSNTITVTIPSVTSLGLYHLLACADDTNVILEIDEANNCVASPGPIVTVTRPDLVERTVSNPPASTAPGGKFAVTDTAANVGGADTSRGSTTRYYLSLDTVKSAGDTLLTGSRSVPALAAGASATGTITVTVPKGTTPATYVLLACADHTTDVEETDETNNCTASTTTVTVTP